MGGAQLMALDPRAQVLLADLVDLLEAVEHLGDGVEDLLAEHPELVEHFETGEYREVEHAAHAARSALRRAGA